MNAKWAIVAIIVVALGIALWASDKITYEGERTVYTVRCEEESGTDSRARERWSPATGTASRRA